MANSFRAYSIDQAYLLPQAPREWLPEGHLAFFLEEMVGRSPSLRSTDWVEDPRLTIPRCS